jgi:predicted transcriptional regulator/uncharacterized protein (DUF2267 family)
MALHAYRHPRLIVQNADTTAFEAALAMRKNEIGSVVVTDKNAIVGIVTDRDLAVRVVGEGRDPRTTSLGEVMSPLVATLEPDASVREALRVMRDRRVRRVPLVEKGRVVGVVTLDDLILEQAITLDDITEVVRAQIIEGGPARTRRFDEWRSLQRRYARALTTWTGLVAQLQATSELETRDRAERAIELVLSSIVRRLPPVSAKRLIARAPALVQAQLRELPPGPDLSVTRASVDLETAKALDVKRSRAAAIVDAVGAILSRSIAPADSLGRHLPSDLKSLLRPRPEPASGLESRRRHRPGKSARRCAPG